MTKNSTGFRLRTARQAAGYKTAIAFCQKYNIKPSTYSLHETGNRSLNPRVARKYANHLNVNFSWLLTGEGPPYTSNNSSAHSGKKKSLSKTEFQTLLDYEGNPEIERNPPVTLEQVDTVLFCYITRKVYEVICATITDLEDESFASKVIEIYQDIVRSTERREDQFTMVDLSITILERQFSSITLKPETT